jgi:hypothetical protein
MAAHIPAPGHQIGPLPPPPPAVAPTSTFLEYYNDASKDEHHRLYTNVMAIFELAPGGQTPAQIRELVTNNPRDLLLGYATLVLSAANPAHQGLIYRIDSVAKFGTRLGKPPTQWDRRIFGSINNVVGHQIPTTVELPVDAFARQDGGVSFRVGLPQLMNAMFGTDMSLELLGVFTNFDAGTDYLPKSWWGPPRHPSPRI